MAARGGELRPVAAVTRGFTKYRERGAYHWRELSVHPLHGWPYTRSRVAWVERQCRGCRTVLEIGCGDAALLGRLAAAGARVTGVDFDETALVLARDLFTKHGLSGEFHAEITSVKGRTFDAVVLAEVIEHLDDADRMLGEAAALLAEDGRLVLTTPIRTLEQSPDPHHVHEFWPRELEALVRRHFEEVELTRMHPVWFVDLLCAGAGGMKPFAVVANLVRLGTGVELIDRVTSPLGVYWTQGVVARRSGRRRA